MGFTTNLAPHRVFSSALKIKKLIAPLFPGPEGARDSNGWCIHVSKGIFVYILSSGGLIKWHLAKLSRILCHVIAFSEDKAGMLRLHNLRATRRIKRI